MKPIYQTPQPNLKPHPPSHINPNPNSSFSSNSSSDNQPAQKLKLLEKAQFKHLMLSNTLFQKYTQQLQAITQSLIKKIIYLKEQFIVQLRYQIFGAILRDGVKLDQKIIGYFQKMVELDLKDITKKEMEEVFGKIRNGKSEVDQLKQLEEIAGNLVKTFHEVLESGIQGKKKSHMGSSTQNSWVSSKSISRSFDNQPPKQNKKYPQNQLQRKNQKQQQQQQLYQSQVVNIYTALKQPEQQYQQDPSGISIGFEQQHSKKEHNNSLIDNLGDKLIFDIPNQSFFREQKHYKKKQEKRLVKVESFDSQDQNDKSSREISYKKRTIKKEGIQQEQILSQLQKSKQISQKQIGREKEKKLGQQLQKEKQRQKAKQRQIQKQKQKQLTNKKTKQQIQKEMFSLSQVKQKQQPKKQKKVYIKKKQQKQPVKQQKQKEKQKEKQKQLKKQQTQVSPTKKLQKRSSNKMVQQPKQQQQQQNSSFYRRIQKPPQNSKNNLTILPPILPLSTFSTYPQKQAYQSQKTKFNLKLKILKIVTHIILRNQKQVKIKFVAGDQTGIVVCFVNYSKEVVQVGNVVQMYGCCLISWKKGTFQINCEKIQLCPKQYGEIKKIGYDCPITMYINAKTLEYQLYYQSKTWPTIKGLAKSYLNNTYKSKCNFSLIAKILQLIPIQEQDLYECLITDGTAKMQARISIPSCPLLKIGEVYYFKKLSIIVEKIGATGILMYINVGNKNQPIKLEQVVINDGEENKKQGKGIQSVYEIIKEGLAQK